MNRAVLNSTIAGILMMGSVAYAKPLPAELVMGNGRSWKGEIIRRDGDWIEFNSETSAKPIRMGISSIKELNFEVKIDTEEISKLVEGLEYERVIDSLSKTLEPFAEYSDIPSNLTRYKAVLMEFHYLEKQYDKSLAISEALAEDERSPALQTKARTFRILALVDSGRPDEARTLLSTYGWDKEPSADDAPEQLYIQAKLLALNGEYRKAMGLVAKVVAFHSQDPDWIQPAEMLCAELYTKLGMYDSAEEVCNQIMILYTHTPEFEQAKKLKRRIATLRAEQNVEETI